MNLFYFTYSLENSHIVSICFIFSPVLFERNHFYKFHMNFLKANCLVMV